MKIRIGDITLEQFYNICNDHPACDNCPLRGRAICLSDEYDLEVNIQDKYFKEKEQ